MTYHVKPRPDGRWGIYDDDQACVGDEDSEAAAHEFVTGREWIFAVGDADLKPDGYWRGVLSMVTRFANPFGIAPKVEK